MIRALYTATSGMMVESRKLDLTSQNLFHAQIPGFRAFRELRAAREPTGAGLPSDVQTVLEGQFVDATPGPFRPTGKDLDLAIEGEGFFTIETPGGTAYTRDGRFRRAGDGVLRDGNGHALVGEEGPLRFPEGARFDAEVEIDPEGTFWVDGKRAGRILVRDFPGYRGLQAAGGSLFYPTGAVPPAPSRATILQRMLEGANVMGVAEMSRMVESIRAFESYQRMIQTVMDDLTGEAVRRLGRVA